MTVTAIVPCTQHDWHSSLEAATCIEAKRIEIQEDRLNPWHTLGITEYDYWIAHPLDCNLDECPYWAEAQGWENAPSLPGIYKWTDEPSRVKLEPLGDDSN